MLFFKLLLNPPLIKYESLYATHWLFDLQSTVLVYNGKITKINGLIVQKHIHLTTFLDKTDFVTCWPTGLIMEVGLKSKGIFTVSSYVMISWLYITAFMFLNPAWIPSFQGAQDDPAFWHQIYPDLCL